MNNNLLKAVKKLIQEVNDDLVGMAENGFTGSSEYDEGYADGLRCYHLELMQLLQEYEH